MTERARTMESDFRRRVFYARLATGVGWVTGVAVVAAAFAVEARDTRFGMLAIAAALAGSGQYWAGRFYRCPRCNARTMPASGPFGTPAARCPKCQQKLTD